MRAFRQFVLFTKYRTNHYFKHYLFLSFLTISLLANSKALIASSPLSNNITGSIDGLLITNGTSSITVSDGGVYHLASLPPGSTLQTMVSGTHESLSWDVNGNTNSKNTEPYDHYWNPIAGSYTITTALYDADDLGGNLLASQTISFTITEEVICELTTDAGVDQTLCEGETTNLTVNVANQKACPTGCTISNSQVIAHWNMDDCWAFADGSSADYSEFTTNAVTMSCSGVTTTRLYKLDGNHSCTDDPSGNPGDAVCIGVPDINAFAENHTGAIRFHVNINPTNDISGITGLEFKELAPANYLWSQAGYQDNTGQNNYPTKYGIRVLKNGTEIFRQEDIPTTQSWTLESFDFSGNADFQVAAQTTFTFELLGYSLVGNGASVAAWDLEDIKVMGGCCTAPVTNEVTYTWSTGATTPSINVNPTSNTQYFVTVTDCEGCTATDSITVNIVSLSTSISGSDVSCNNQTDGNASVTINGGDAPYTILWSNGASTDNTDNLAAGTYTVMVTDNNGCESENSITINEPDPIDFDATWVDVSCFNGNDGSIDLIVSGGTAPYTINWSNGANTEDISNLTADEYSVSVTDQNGCNNTISFTINQATELILNTNSTNVHCNGDNDGSIDLSVTGGNGNYTYFWDNGATTEDINGLNAGTYAVTVFDNNQCPATTQATISEATLLSANVYQTGNVSCEDGSDGFVAVAVNGGTEPYSFLWSNGATSQNIDLLPAGNYTVSIEDANGCNTIVHATVNQPDAIDVNVSPTDVDCFESTDGSVSLTISGGTAPYTFLWNNGATTADLNNLSAGNYDVTISDNNGCTSTTSATINQPDPIGFDATWVDVSCFNGNDGSIDLIVSGGTAPYTINWSNGANTEDISNLTADEYSVSVTDQNGCNNTISFTINQAAEIVLNTNSTDVNCNGDSDGSIDLSVTGGNGNYTYVWSNGATTEDLTGLSAGSYTVTIYDANQCSASTQTTIQEPSPILPEILDIGNVTCNNGDDGFILLDVNGGTSPYSFEWDNGDIIQNIDFLTAGEYTVTIEDANGCTAVLNAFVEEPLVLEVNNTITNPSCFTGNDGSVELVIVGGVAPYTFGWNTGATTDNLSNVSAGNYNVTVSDDNGCSVFHSITLANPAELTAAAFVTNPLSLRGGTDASVRVSASGGTGNYTYLWSSGENTQSVTDLTAGDYFVTVTDENNCATIAQVTVEDPARLGNFVWEDLNANGIQDNGEPGIEDVLITLTGDDIHGNPVNKTTTSSSTGFYDFDGLNPGSYTVTFGQLSNYFYTAENAIGNESLDSDARSPNGVTATINLKAGDYADDVDAGYFRKITIGDYVWFDQDEDKLQTIGEPGINGVEVHLLGPGKDGVLGTEDDEILATQTTQNNGTADGYYQFTDVTPGNCILQFDPKSITGYQFIKADQGDDNMDSDVADNATGRTDIISLVSGQDDNSIDAGLLLDCNLQPGFSTKSFICEQTLAEFTADDEGSGATYSWLFFNGASSSSTYLGSGSGIITNMQFPSDGKKYVILSVELPNGCQGTYEQIIDIIANVKDGGLISGDETGCDAFDPNTIASPLAPGNLFEAEYIWMWSHQANPPTSENDPNWTIIPGATKESYDPDFITETTYFVRLVRNESCEEYTGISNVVVKAVEFQTIPVSFTSQQLICEDRLTSFSAIDYGKDATYEWYFFNGSSINSTFLGTRDGQDIEFQFGSFGDKMVRLFITTETGCEGALDSVITVTPASDPYCIGPQNVITSFNANPTEDNQVLLNWNYDINDNNLVYTLEHSMDGGNFEAIGIVQGNGSLQYEYLDETPIFGVNYYRLKIINDNGDYTFSQIEEVAIRQESNNGFVYPNPATEMTNLQMEEPFEAQTTVEIISTEGEILDAIQVEEGATNVQIDLTNYRSGYYFIYSNALGNRTLLTRIMKIDL